MDIVSQGMLDEIFQNLSIAAKHEYSIFKVFIEPGEVRAERIYPMFPEQGFSEEYDTVIFRITENMLKIYAAGCWRSLPDFKLIDAERLVKEALE